ncbi:hypothetical protein RSAG8_13096, partial [Rhizoctonia solani AG-8 WAC10335]
MPHPNLTTINHDSMETFLETLECRPRLPELRWGMTRFGWTWWGGRVASQGGRYLGNKTQRVRRDKTRKAKLLDVGVDFNVHSLPWIPLAQLYRSHQFTFCGCRRDLPVRSKYLFSRPNRVQRDLAWPPIADSCPTCPWKHLASAVDHSPFRIPASSQISDFFKICVDG